MKKRLNKEINNRPNKKEQHISKIYGFIMCLLVSIGSGCCLTLLALTLESSSIDISKIVLWAICLICTVMLRKISKHSLRG